MSKLTPEHDSRHPDSDSYSEVTAAYKYVDSVLSTADAQSPVNGLAWHGWALREAFLAGCTHAAEQLRTTRRPTPQPVAVSERLPVPEDCTTNPRTSQGQWCWGWVQHGLAPYSGRWRMMRREWITDEATHWLPANALPLPAGEGAS